MKTLKLIIDDKVLSRYEEYYFSIHTKAKKKPIAHPYHESINEWMIMKRPMMNALKQRWKAFGEWFVKDQGYANLHINKCDLTYITYYATNRPHDTDNSVPKFLTDGLVNGGLFKSDDSKCIASTKLICRVDYENPRTEIRIKIKE